MHLEIEMWGLSVSTYETYVERKHVQMSLRQGYSKVLKLLLKPHNIVAVLEYISKAIASRHLTVDAAKTYFQDTLVPFELWKPTLFNPRTSVLVLLNRNSSNKGIVLKMRLFYVVIFLDLADAVTVQYSNTTVILQWH